MGFFFGTSHDANTVTAAILRRFTLAPRKGGLFRNLRQCSPHGGPNTASQDADMYILKGLRDKLNDTQSGGIKSPQETCIVNGYIMFWFV